MVLFNSDAIGYSIRFDYQITRNKRIGMISLLHEYANPLALILRLDRHCVQFSYCALSFHISIHFFDKAYG
jgi:hypothetical protein